MKLILLPLILFAAFVPGFAQKRVKPPAIRQNASLDQINAVVKYFDAQGYKLVQASSLQPPTEWESRNFNMKSKTVLAVKSKHRVKGWKEKTYYRFSFILETYENDEGARIRIERLYEPPPQSPNTRMDKAFPLREGFNSSKKVYIITTDVEAFTPELVRLTKGLQNIIEGE